MTYLGLWTKERKRDIINLLRQDEPSQKSLGRGGGRGRGAGFAGGVKFKETFILGQFFFQIYGPKKPKQNGTFSNIFMG